LIRFTCSQCGKHLKVEERFAGKKGRCTCGNHIDIPEITQEEQEQSKIDDKPENHTYGKTKSRNIKFVYIILLCIVVGVLGILILTVSGSKDENERDEIESDVVSHVTSNSTDRQNEANASSNAWALFVTNNRFISQCYGEENNIYTGKTIKYGEDIINSAYDTCTELEIDFVILPIKESFTIAEVVSEIGQYRLLNKSTTLPPDILKLDEYHWDHFYLYTKENDDKVMKLFLFTKEISQLLPPGVKLTEAAQTYLAENNHP
jgi:hypothetical protein